MAGVIKVNGNYHSEEMIHRDLFFKSVGNGGGAISQADFDLLMQEVHLTCTIEVIGEFIAGTSTAVNVMISGADVIALSGSGTIGDLAGW